jgi:hypothetical protein
VGVGEEDNAEWEADEKVQEGWPIIDEASVDLVHAEPTSVAGAIALLNYFAERTARDVTLLDGLYDDDDPTVSKTSGAPYCYFIARKVAQALGKIAV